MQGTPLRVPLRCFRIQSAACDMLPRFCARRMLWPPGFTLAAALGSICSATRCRALFAGFTATMAASDFSRLYIIGFDFRLLSVAAPHDSVAA